MKLTGWGSAASAGSSALITNGPFEVFTDTKSRNPLLGIAGAGLRFEFSEPSVHLGPQRQFWPQQQGLIPTDAAPVEQSVVNIREQNAGPARLNTSTAVIADRNRWDARNMAVNKRANHCSRTYFITLTTSNLSPTNTAGKSGATGWRGVAS